jgi:insertion element IS1 protein InsB
LKKRQQPFLIELSKISLQGVAAVHNLSCPHCKLSHSKKNGHTHYGKQNHQCKGCGRQFVTDSQRITEDERQRIKKLLLERISLCGICRVMGVSLRWLLVVL